VLLRTFIGDVAPRVRERVAAARVLTGAVRSCTAVATTRPLC
jgi:hypothetical protein